MELTALIAVAFVLLVLGGALLSCRRCRALPPSPPSLPFLGHLHLLGKLPHQSLLKLSQEYGEFMYLRLGSVDALVASSPNAAREILKTHDKVFASRPVTTGAQNSYKEASLLRAPYGDNWKKMRRLCTGELLTSKRLEVFRPVRKFEMALLLQTLHASAKEGALVNMSSCLSDLTFNVMMRMVANKRYAAGSPDQEQALLFKNAITEAFLLADDYLIGDFIPWLKWLDKEAPRLKEIQGTLDRFLQRQVDEHRTCWKPNGDSKDFMDVMLDQGLSDTRIKALALDMIAAGTDTTALTTEWALSELIRNPKVLNNAKKELENVAGRERTLDESDLPKLKYLHAVVKETFRLHPTVPILNHESTDACKVSGYTVPAKARTIVNVYAIGRDPTIWDEPLTFNPDRFLRGSTVDVKGQYFELLPFGSGRRMCPGQLVGLNMVQFMLGTLVHAFEWFIPDGIRAEELDMTEAYGLTTSRSSPLQLRPSPSLSPDAYSRHQSG